MINGITLTNVNAKIIKGKLSKIFISEVRVKLIALRINRYTRSSSQFQKGWRPCNRTYRHFFAGQCFEPHTSIAKRETHKTLLENFLLHQEVFDREKT